MGRQNCRGGWMSDKVEVAVDEIKRVFELIERVHEFLHQPQNFGEVESFAAQCYPELHGVYYDVVWNWLPQDVKSFYENR
jgi:hypothetical protein